MIYTYISVPESLLETYLILWDLPLLWVGECPCTVSSFRAITLAIGWQVAFRLALCMRLCLPFLYDRTPIIISWYIMRYDMSKSLQQFSGSLQALEFCCRNILYYDAIGISTWPIQYVFIPLAHLGEGRSFPTDGKVLSLCSRDLKHRYIMMSSQKRRLSSLIYLAWF